mgnify:CR=1 FL=1
MAQDVLDSAFGVADPAPLSELPSAEEAIELRESELEDQ